MERTMKKITSLYFLFAITVALGSSAINASDLISRPAKKSWSKLKRLAIGSVFVSATAAATYYYKDYIKGILPLLHSLRCECIIYIVDTIDFTQEEKDQITQKRLDLLKKYEDDLQNLREKSFEIFEVQRTQALEDLKLKWSDLKKSFYDQSLKELDTKLESITETIGECSNIGALQKETVQELLTQVKTLQEQIGKCALNDEVAQKIQTQNEALQTLSNLATPLQAQVVALQEKIANLETPKPTTALLSDLLVRITNASIPIAQELKTFTQETIVPFVARETDKVINNPENVGKLNFNPEYQGYDFSPLG